MLQEKALGIILALFSLSLLRFYDTIESERGDSVYSAKIYYTSNFRTHAETVDNIISWVCDENGGVTITFGDQKNPMIIKRHKTDIEDVHIFKVNPAIF